MESKEAPFVHSFLPISPPLGNRREKKRGGGKKEVRVSWSPPFSTCPSLLDEKKGKKRGERIFREDLSYQALCLEKEEEKEGKECLPQPRHLTRLLYHFPFRSSLLSEVRGKKKGEGGGRKEKGGNNSGG